MFGKLFFLLFGLVGFLYPIAYADEKTVYFQDNGEVLKNPGMGWVIYYYANSLKYYAKDIDKLSDEQLFSFPGLSVAMFRLSWSNLEEKEGVYSWNLIDRPAERFIRNGVKVAIRVSNSENVADQPYATPKWVFDSGAKAHRFRPGYPGVLDEANGSNYEPDFGDPVFKVKLKNFVNSLASKYDGDANVAFIDVGSFGVYGEGHTWSSTKIPYGENVIKDHIDIYRNAFKKTALIANHNFADHNQLGHKNRDLSPIVYSAEKGLGFRDDSILIDKGPRAYYDQDMAKLFFEKAPVILETGEYSTRVKKGYWSEEKILDSIKEYHASYIGAYWSPYDYLMANAELIKKVNSIIGYRFSFENIKYATVIDRQKVLKVAYRIKNSGVARCLNDGFVNFSIYSGSGRRVASGMDRSNNLRDIYSKGAYEETSREGHVSIPLYGILPGSYKLYVSISDMNGNAWMQLPHSGEKEEKRYLVGAVVIGNNEKEFK